MEFALQTGMETGMEDYIMAWYDSAVFYHIYPFGLCGCAHENTGVSESHFDKLTEWADHARDIGCTGIYIGPLFESVGHGYETTDYKRVDCRLGTNDDFKQWVKHCHDMGVKVIVDGVFNHTGREFFAFKDIREKREGSEYRDWYCNVNFGGNNSFNDGFSYDNWGGYDLLAKLNQWNPAVREYLFDVVRFWVSEFDIDGIRLDAADVLDHNFMHELRGVTDSLKPEFWLMGEVIHGDYSRWANGDMLHSVTNYELHKGLYSGHNDHNYFEIAHSIKRLAGICGDVRLYTFVDNHDVERIYTKLNNKEHIYNVTILDYTVPGIPSVYYGSEFGIEGRKENGSDWGLRPDLELGRLDSQCELTQLCKKLGHLKKEFPELTYGEYKELLLTNRQFAYGRIKDGRAVIIALNNDDNAAHLEIPLPVGADAAVDLLSIMEEEKEGEKDTAADDEAAAQEAVLAKKKEQAAAMQDAVDRAARLSRYLSEAQEQIGSGGEINDLSNQCYSQTDNLKAAITEMFRAFGGMSVPQGNADVSSCTGAEVRDGKLIVDLPANRGGVYGLGF